MSDVEFYQTRMGKEFYDRTMPDLVRQLTRLNDLLEVLLRERESLGHAPDESGGGAS